QHPPISGAHAVHRRALTPLAALAHAPTCQRCRAVGRSPRSYLPHFLHLVHPTHLTGPPLSLLHRCTTAIPTSRAQPHFAAAASSATASAPPYSSSCSCWRSPSIASTTSAPRSLPSPRSVRRLIT